MNLINVFEVVNRKDLAFEYQLLAIEGLTPGDHYARNLNLLQKDVANEIQQPVTLTSFQGQPCLALPAGVSMPILDWTLTPDVATLRPLGEVFSLDFQNLDENTCPIAVKMLTWAFQNALRNQHELWGDRNSYFWKKPIREGNDVQMFEGFRFRVVFLPPDALALCVDTSHKYADTKRLTVRVNGNWAAYRNRHFLYHFGHNWFRGQLMNPTGNSIRAQKFTDRDGRVIDVYSYTQEKCRNQMPSWVRDLDPNSPAIIYRNPGNEQNRYGAAALCKLLYRTDDPDVRGLHRDSILQPHQRLNKIVNVVGDYFQDAYLGEAGIELAQDPKEVTRRFFPVPDLLFGHQKRLHVKRNERDDTETGVSIRDFAQARLRFLTGKESGGTYVTTPFSTQYLLMPASLPEAIQDSFQERLTQVIEGIYPQYYRMQTILYDDTGRSCASQVQAIRAALQRKNVSKGYAVLLLPENADSQLHNSLKRECWPHLQFQCARVRGVRDFYIRRTDNGKECWEVDRNRERDYISYLRYLAFGVLLVNRKWPFMLADPQHYDLYIGVDVLNNTVGMTFFYPVEGLCHFYHNTSQHKEKVSKRQMEAIILEQVGLLLDECGRPPRSIVFLRDGISYPCERRGAGCALKTLQSAGRLPVTLRVGTVEIHKQSAVPLRMFHCKDSRIQNPTLGDPFIMNDQEGFICTTGFPFSARGTVRPLHFKIVDGPLNIAWILEDALGQAVLAWSAPDRSSRLPMIISLCDLFLQPVASKVVEDVLEEEDEEANDEDE